VAAERSHLQRMLESERTHNVDLRRRVIIATGGGALVVALLLYSVIAGGLTRRLNQLIDMARSIAAGDYSQRHLAEGRDEVALLARTFNEMAAQLAAFDKVKEEFVALASHQLRTPATAVKANLGMLLEGYCGELTAEQAGVVRDANDSNERQLKIIDDLLWVARTDAGRLSLSRAPTDVAQLAAEVVAEQAHVARERRQSLALDPAPALRPVDADPQKLRMVLENLVSNASKYTPEGGAIRVSVGQDDAGTRLAVSDTGVGIAPEDQGRLFNKFQRIDNVLSTQVGGTGLGLYLAHEIVRLHGGSIAVESRPGAGTTFTVTLPRS
jgi:signal transduction histidine kinase